MIPDELLQVLGPRTPDRAVWCHFDIEWYLTAYPEVRDSLSGEATDDAVRQFYVDRGRALGHSPNMFVDEAWYLRRYPDAAAAVRNGQSGSGYEHYCAIGYLNRSPHWLYDEALYLLQSPDLTDARLLEAECVNYYDHYLKSGSREGRVAHLLFHPAIYRAGLANPGAPEARNAFEHFLHRAWIERLDGETSLFFDQGWFVGQYPDVVSEIANGRWCSALHAYLAQPQAGFDPCPYFSESYYLSEHQDARDAVAANEAQSGYDHFLKVGVYALRAPSPDIDLAAFADRRPGIAARIAMGQERDAFLAFLRAPPEERRLAVASTPVVDMPQLPAPIVRTGYGHIEFFGHQMAAHGWFFCGWISPPPDCYEAEAQIVARFEMGQLTATGTVATLPRADVADFGIGVVIFIEEAGASLGNLQTMTIDINDGGPQGWSLSATDHVAQYRDQVMSANIVPVINQLFPSAAKPRLENLAGRRGYTGVNTLGELRDKVFLEIDEAIACPRHGIALVGWALWEPGAVVQVRLQSGHIVTDINFDDAIRLDRPDVRDSVGAQYGLTELASGFIVFLPHGLVPDETTYLEIETARGEFAYRGLPTPKLRGITAIRFLLDRIDLRYGEVGKAFDRILGPAVTMLNNDRLRTPARHTEITFGTPPANPELSVIITLYGRLDFMEYQLGFASRHTPTIPVEYIYVLDDPGKKREAENLASSLWQRFRIPLRLIELERNMGFAPANNVGLELARGNYICFLNSDVFAGTDDWMERMVARLRDNPRLGAVGPMLLFEDGCVQHQGMTYERLPLFANWYFPMHTRKGWRPTDETGLVRCVAITGACMVMRRSVAVEFGGFDESYIIGDFEDSDLCMKLRERGLECAVDMSAHLYHLERQSQAGTENRWRMNLTVYNAWVHERRWQDMLTRIEAAEART